MMHNIALGCQGEDGCCFTGQEDAPLAVVGRASTCTRRGGAIEVR
jgi:hypothetical protein